MRILESTAADGGLTGGTKSDQILTHYDLADMDPLSPPGATFLVGNISYTEKPGISKTWFSYDERGRVAWSAQWLQGFGATVVASIHKVEYRYDYSGNVQEVAYNRGQSDQFYHVYQYDADNRLAEVFTSTIAPVYTLTGQPDKSVPLLRQAAYSYYLHGPLKRVELANGLQGVDYVYTVQGWLKSINNFRPDTNRDPGADGNDLFGMSIDYYNGDYLSKTGFVIGSPSIAGLTVPEKHSGNIRAVSWFSQKPTYDLTSSNPTAYQYSYDDKDQLTAAQWGTVGAPTNTFTASSPTMYAEKGITYDANGNMKALQRYDAAGNFLQTGNVQTGIATHNFTAYHYQGNTNRLTSIEGYNTSYSYNAIGQLQSSSNGTKSKYPTYDARGMVTSVTSDAAHTDPYVKSYYDDNGLRYKKESYHGTTMVTTWYKYDASGNMLAVYDDNNTTQVLQKTETPIYAANRIGSYYHGVDNTEHYRYELTDHLGTVRATFSPDPVTPAVPKVESYADYYPYGLVLRSAVAERYRFGYQGQYAEYDPETETNHFQLRDYDPVIGRWFGPDPYRIGSSPYIGMGNNPVTNTDPDGGAPQDDIHINSQTNTYTVKVTDTDGNHRIFVDGVQTGSFTGGYSIDTQFGENGIANGVNINGSSYQSYSLDPSTLRHNLFYDSYTGGNNPKSYNGKDNYTAPIENLSDAVSFDHDKGYDVYGATAGLDLLINTKVIGVDSRFVSHQFGIVNLYASQFFQKPIIDPYTNQSISFGTALKASTAGAGLFILTFPKSIVHTLGQVPYNTGLIKR